MIDRYSMPEMAALFTDEARFARWLEVELLATEAWADLGVVPREDAVRARQAAPIVDAAFVSDVATREALTDHDVAAFVDVVQERIGGTAGKWIHYGLTSSDVVDTALCSTLTAAADLLIAAASDLVVVLKRRAHELRDAAMAGRTHGVHAEPTTFGTKLALWCLQVDRDRTRLHHARAVGGSREALGRRRHLLQHRSRRRSVGLRGARPAAGARDAGDQPRSPRRVPVRVCVGRRDDRDDLDGGAAPPTHRGGRGRGGVQAGPEGLVRDAAQAQPDHGRAAVGPRPHPSRELIGGPRGREPLARTGHLALVGRASDPARLVAARLLRLAQGGVADRRPARRHRSDARQPRALARARVQPAGASRARRVGVAARRRVSHRPGGRRDGTRRGQAVPFGPRRRRAGDVARRPARRSVRPRAGTAQHRPACSTRWIAVE